ncbi:ATP-grasp domain-containing protein [Streptosporangium sp. NPDC048047]|uniref:ATP-grasp domain-containing protein n=1 Tax=Streptosporangium sp. NPDC048047 TaxID=3155748 RepID=UPI0034331CDD
MLIGGMSIHPAVAKPALQTLAQHRLVVADTVQATWQAPYIRDELHPLDLSIDHVLRSIEASRQPVAGVLTLNEHLATLTAAVAERLDVPSYGSRAAMTADDKWRLHQRLQAADCPTPPARLATGVDEAVAAAAGIGYPVVLKVRNRTEGRGVFLARSMPEAVAFSAEAVDQSRGGVVVEAYLPGPELTVICLTQAGHSSIVAVARTMTDFMPSATVLGHLVDAGDPARMSPPIAQAARGALSALGVRDGCSEVKLCLTPHGPVVIGVNSVAGGSLLAQTVQLASGADLVAECAATALGRPVGYPDQEYQSAVLEYVHAATTGRVRHLAVPKDLAGMPWAQQMGWLVAPEEQLIVRPKEAPARVGYVIVTSRDPRQSLALAHRARMGMRIDIEAIKLAA